MTHLEIVFSRMKEKNTALRLELNSVREEFNYLKVELGKTHAKEKVTDAGDRVSPLESIKSNRASNSEWSY